MPRSLLTVLALLAAAPGGCAPPKPPNSVPAEAQPVAAAWTMIPASDLISPNHAESYRSTPCLVTVRKNGGVTLNTHVGDLSQWVDISPAGGGRASIQKNVTRWEWVRSRTAAGTSVAYALSENHAPDLFAKYCGKKAASLPEAVKKQFYGHYVTAKG